MTAAPKNDKKGLWTRIIEVWAKNSRLISLIFLITIDSFAVLCYTYLDWSMKG